MSKKGSALRYRNNRSCKTQFEYKSTIDLLFLIIFNRGFVPTVLVIGPYRFYFYSHETNEPPHVHVDREKFSAKFWLLEVSLADNLGFQKKELTVLLELVNKHQKQFLDQRYEYFSPKNR